MRLQDFVSAVMDVDYSPTGREFVAGSYDHSVRVFAYNGGHSRDVYHTKRMQRVFCVRFSGDGSYVFTGSDDMNVRVWKAEASAQMGVRLPREKHKQAYQTALVNRYKHLPEIKRIVRHRRVPMGIYKVGPLAFGCAACCILTQTTARTACCGCDCSGYSVPCCWCLHVFLKPAAGLTRAAAIFAHAGRQGAQESTGGRQPQAAEPHQAQQAWQHHSQAGAQEEDHCSSGVSSAPGVQGQVVLGSAAAVPGGMLVVCWVVSTEPCGHMCEAATHLQGRIGTLQSFSSSQQQQCLLSRRDGWRRVADPTSIRQ
jgi:WD repeat and SOF domain-containing protein 1